MSRSRKWLLGVGVVLLLFAIGGAIWLWRYRRSPLQVSLQVAPGINPICQGSPRCIAVRYSIKNRGFIHVFVSCEVSVVDSAGRMLAQAHLEWDQVPIGPEISPHQTAQGVGVLSIPAPPGTFSLVPHCKPVYWHGPPAT